MVAATARTITVAVLLTLTTSSQGLLTTASKTKGGYDYNFATVPFLAEVVKLCISSYLLSKQKQQQPEAARTTRQWKTALLFLVPSIIYWIHNNVQFLTLRLVDPATYQILGNLKIVTTGILFWVILRRKLTLLQWQALVLLTIGAMISQLQSHGKTNSTFTAPTLGYLLAGLSALLSALAAVYTEWAMKLNNDSLYWQNMQLYSFGVAFNALGLTINDVRQGGTGLWMLHLFQGYSLVTCMVVLNLAVSGLLVSWIMKFADSIMKVYATSMSMLVTTVASVALFGLSPSLQLYLGILTASISLSLYYMPPSMLFATEASTKAKGSLLPVSMQQKGSIT